MVLTSRSRRNGIVQASKNRMSRSCGASERKSSSPMHNPQPHNRKSSNCLFGGDGRWQAAEKMLAMRFPKICSGAPNRTVMVSAVHSGSPLAASRNSSGEDVPLLSSDTPPQPKPKRDALLHFDRSDEGRQKPKHLLHPATIPTAGNRIEPGPPKIVSPLQHSLEIACSTVTDQTEQKNKFHRSSTKEEASL